MKAARFVKRSGVLGFAAALALAAAGCGGDSSSDQPTTFAMAPIRGPQPPKNASPLLESIYRNFQPPQADPSVKGSGKAIKEGEKACKGKTPLEVKQEFIAQSDLTADQLKEVAKLAKYQQRPSPDFPAGQLAALVYQNALNVNEPYASYGFQGCVYVLALQLKQQLTKQQKEKKSR
ncbi:MAG TPA: hypothetical protein VF176_05520 [Solirubrobacterales bacterium]